jgi:hypothetical protein
MENNKSVTAVEWLRQELLKRDMDNSIKDLFEQAKEMEKEQIIDAFGVGCQVESTRLIGYHGMAEQYYNESYKQD